MDFKNFKIFKSIGKEINVKSFGIKVQIIDFDNVRLEHEGVVTFKNLECLVGQGKDAHWKCYNDMRKVLSESGDAKDSDDIWKRSNLKTNLIWLKYVSKELAKKCKKYNNIFKLIKIDKSCSSCAAYTSSANFKALCKKLE
uniref:Uncharacterized protein n=1 Tax=Panagrolaimus sp. PS1159 TaxID=55785 RepID=A0AC35GXX1_9BILA